MGSVHGEGKGRGIWVLYQGVKYWLSEVTRGQFEEFKSKGLSFDYAIEKDGQSFLVPLSQLELAE